MYAVTILHINTSNNFTCLKTKISLSESTYFTVTDQFVMKITSL